MKKIILLMSLFSAAALANEVVINDSVRNNFGISTAKISATSVTQQWQATATVLDAASLITAITDLRAAQAVSAASSSELKRTQALHQDDNGVALKVVEAANAQAIADRGKVQSLRAQLQTTWGSAVRRMNDGELEQLARQVLSGTVLLRAELIGGVPVNMKITKALLYEQSGPPLTGRVIGSLPLSAEQAIGRAFLLSVDANHLDLQPGQVLRAELHDANRTVAGSLVPRAALVRWQGQQWLYVQHAVGHYERIAVQVQQWLTDGALINAGVQPGDQVVITGAGLLLGAEHAPAEHEDSEKSVDKD